MYFKSIFSKNHLIPLGLGKINLQGIVHDSVGIEYVVKYPKHAFLSQITRTYLHPEKMKRGMCGGDEAILGYEITPLKTGLFLIIEEQSFRGKIERRTIHHFLVVKGKHRKAIDVSISNAEDISGFRISDRYEIVSEIGAGGYAKVLKCIDYKNNNYCAIKIYDKSRLSPEQSRQIVASHKKYANYKHPNIASICDCFVEDGHAHIVMPYYERGTIAAQRGTLTEQELWKVCSDIAKGLEYLHSHSVLHLDVKPSNILQDNEGNYVLSDFCISREMKELTLNNIPEMTEGTISYMAPERFSGQTAISAACDIWSLGATLCELAMGLPPFHGLGGREQVLLGECGLPLRLGSQFSNRMNDLIVACLNQEARGRPGAGEVIEICNNNIGFSSPSSQSLRTVSQVNAQSHFYGVYSEDATKRMNNYIIACSKESSLYGITDVAGKQLVEYLYDSIKPFAETSWPGPGPLPPSESFFLGAFFKQGEDVGYLYIRDDGSIAEYRRCSQQEFTERCQMT